MGEEVQGKVWEKENSQRQVYGPQERGHRLNSGHSGYCPEMQTGALLPYPCSPGPVSSPPMSQAVESRNGILVPRDDSGPQECKYRIWI